MKLSDAVIGVALAIIANLVLGVLVVALITAAATVWVLLISVIP